MQFISFMPIIMVNADTIRYIEKFDMYLTDTIRFIGIDDTIFRFFDISAQL